MHPGEEKKDEKLHGISAVLAVADGLTELEGAVLDLAAVLDGLADGNFEIIVEVALAGPAADQLAGLQLGRPGLPLRVQMSKQIGQAATLAAGFGAATYDLILV